MLRLNIVQYKARNWNEYADVLLDLGWLWVGCPTPGGWGDVMHPGSSKDWNACLNEANRWYDHDWYTSQGYTNWLAWNDVVREGV